MFKIDAGNPRVLAAACMALLLAACALPQEPHRPSPYAQDRLFGGGGYSDEKLEANRFIVAFRGNAYTGEDMVVKYWLNRCAELTVQNGYRYFTLVPGSATPMARPDMSEVSSYDLAPAERERLHGQGAAAAPAGGFVQVRGGGAPTFIWIPSGGGGVTTWSKKGIIEMFHSRSGGQSPQQAVALHARTVLDLLKAFMDSHGEVPGPDRRELIGTAMRVMPAGER